MAIEVGGSGDMSEWPPQFVNMLGAATTTCLYSRAGGAGSSEPVQRPVSMDDVTGDAFEFREIAKAQAGVEGPYVFVGWSLGGSVALGDALARPDQAVGMAIIDTDFPADGLALCKASGRPEADCQAEYEADIDARFMESQIAHAAHPLALPAVLVTAMDYPDCVETPGATLSAEIAGVTLFDDDCAGLAAAIADKPFPRRAVALPQRTPTAARAKHLRHGKAQQFRARIGSSVHRWPGQKMDSSGACDCTLSASTPAPYSDSPARGVYCSRNASKIAPSLPALASGADVRLTHMRTMPGGSARRCSGLSRRASCMK